MVIMRSVEEVCDYLVVEAPWEVLCRCMLVLSVKAVIRVPSCSGQLYNELCDIWQF